MYRLGRSGGVKASPLVDGSRSTRAGQLVQPNWRATESPVPANIDNSPDSAYTGVNLQSVSCASTARCVAVGSYGAKPIGNAEGLLDTWSVGSWTAAEAPPPGADATGISLNTVSCSTEASCVAIGDYFEGGNVNNIRGVIETFARGSWTQPKPHCRRTPTWTHSRFS